MRGDRNRERDNLDKVGRGEIERERLERES